MKILSVSHYYPPHIGGLEIVAQKQAQSLVEGGNIVVVVTFCSYGEKPRSVKEGDVLVHRISAINFFDKNFGIPFPIGGIGLVLRLWREVKEADVIHIHDVFYQSSWIACVFSWLMNKPVYLTQHVGIVEYPNKLITLIQRFVYASFGRFIFQYSRKIIVYNHNVKDFLHKQNISSDKIIELRNGIDPSIFYPEDKKNKMRLRAEFGISGDKPIILFVGRLVPKKGIDAVFEARDEKYHIVFVGSGKVPREWLESSNVHFFDSLSQSELSKMYRLADIFVFPSHGEVFTLAMQEAMASGLPVITTDEPAYKKYDIDRNLISFIRPNSEELKKNINRIIADEKLRARMSEYSVKLARELFDWRVNVCRIVDLYSSVRKRISRIAVTTSWDDGHILDLRLARLMKKYSIKGTFYISPKNREFKAPELLNDNNIISLSRDFEVGAHTLTHPRLNALVSGQSDAEIKESKQYLEQLTGKSVESFCYPGGCYNSTNIHQVKNAGFLLARTVERFSFDIGRSFYMLPTSIHAYNHWLDAWNIALFTEFNPFVFLRYYRNWDILAMAMFDRVVSHGGIFHLWGHSWEIDKNNDWDRLERVFRYISYRRDVMYVTNRELI